MMTRKRERHETGPGTPSVRTRANKRRRRHSKKVPELEIAPPMEQPSKAEEKDSAAKTTSENEEHVIENTIPHHGAGEASELEERKSPELGDASAELGDASPELGEASPELGDASPELGDAREPEAMGASGDHQE
ncbi:hypothetical protein Aduo_019520 [Ancylostoma duodenale]